MPRQLDQKPVQDLPGVRAGRLVGARVARPDLRKARALVRCQIERLSWTVGVEEVAVVADGRARADRAAYIGPDFFALSRHRDGGFRRRRRRGLGLGRRDRGTRLRRAIARRLVPALADKSAVIYQTL